MRPKCNCGNIAGYWYAPVIYKIMDYEEALESHVFCEECVPKHEDAWAEYEYVGFHKKDWTWLNKKKFIESIEKTNEWLRLPYYDVSHVKDGVRWAYGRYRDVSVMHKEIEGLVGVEIKEGWYEQNPRHNTRA